MTPRLLIALSIFVLMLFTLALAASRVSPEGERQETPELNPLLGDVLFFGFLVTYAIALLQHAGAVP